MPLTLPLNSDEIKRLQRALNYAIWNNDTKFIPITGVADAETRRSVREFQRVFDLPQNGELSNELLAMIEAEMSRKRVTDF